MGLMYSGRTGVHVPSRPERRGADRGGEAVSPGTAGAFHAAHTCRSGFRSAADVRERVPVAAPGLGYTSLNVHAHFDIHSCFSSARRGEKYLRIKRG